MTTTMKMITRDALHSTVGISFWGGIDPHTGHIIDPTHPLHGECISNKILCIPSGRGSCTGSQVMLELILSGLAPHAILTRDRDAILVAGAMVAEEFFGDELGPGAVPIFAAVGDADFARLVGRRTLSIARLDDDGGGGGGGGSGALCIRGGDDDGDGGDLEILAGDLLRLEGTLLASECDDESSPSRHYSSSPAERMARRTLGRIASIHSATHLVPVSSAHVDAVTYIGRGGLRFARKLVELGGRVQVP